MNNPKQYTISVFTENHIGLLNRITVIFTRRKINIDSLTTSSSALEGIYRFTIVIHTSPEDIIKIIQQIEKQVEVIKAFYYDEEDIIYQEIALYKIPTTAVANSKAVEKIVRDNHARILAVEPEFIVVEKTGHEYETKELFEKLKPYGVLSFVRSGRVSIAKPMEKLTSYLEKLDKLEARY